MCDPLDALNTIFGAGHRGVTDIEWQQEMWKQQAAGQGQALGQLQWLGMTDPERYHEAMRHAQGGFMPRTWLRTPTSFTIGDYLKEKPTMQIYTEKIDKHLLIKVGCNKRIAHDKKELRKVMIEFLDKNLDTLWDAGLPLTPEIPPDAPYPGQMKMAVDPSAKASRDAG